MNFKLFLLLSIFLSSCGVKAPPRADASSDIPSIVDQYKKQLISDLDEESEESKKTNKK